MNKASVICEEIRSKAGFSVRAMASAAGVAASTVQRIESGLMSPTIEMLELLAGSAGSRLRITAEVDYSLNIVGLALSIRNDVASSDERDVVRKTAEFVSTFRRAKKSSRMAMIESRPPLTGSSKWDAFLGGVAEWLCSSERMAPPSWVYEKARYLTPSTWITEMKSLQPYEFAGTPASLQSRGVYIHRDSLENV